MSILMLICGLPGTGKTTIAKKFSAKRGGIILRTDVIRKEIGALGYSEKEMSRVYKEMFSRAEKLLKERKAAADEASLAPKGRDVFLDATFAKRSWRRTARKIAQSLGAECVIIEVVCPEKIVKKRMAGRKRDESGAKFKHYLEVKKRFEPIAERHIVINTGMYYNETWSR